MLSNLPSRRRGRQTVLPMQMCWEHQMDSRGLPASLAEEL